MLGLANFLRRHNVTYESFGRALKAPDNSPAGVLATELQRAIEGAASVARSNSMARAFAIAPTASCSYRYTDLDGFTTTPEIAPPIARKVDRDSGTFGVESFNYGDVEIASEVGWDAYLDVVNGVVSMLDKTGLLHGYSFNSWSDVVTYDEEFIESWLNSPQTSLYYALQVMPDTQDKSSVYAALDAAEVENYLESLLEDPGKPMCDCAE